MAISFPGFGQRLAWNISFRKEQRFNGKLPARRYFLSPARTPSRSKYIPAFRWDRIHEEYNASSLHLSISTIQGDERHAW
ncbi:MAG: hypothetical protein ABIH38_01200 [Patescibacteria group bacterium]